MENRRYWILETIRENQEIVIELLKSAVEGDYRHCNILLDSLYGNDRDALMQPEGIFTPEQRKGIYEA